MVEERIQSIALHHEMQRSYLEYAMSVIVGRALPDVRDGLKPVQRRILYAMHELDLTPNHAYRKCARVVGDVLGKYHPHGDQAVYDALVRLAQNFANRHPLLDGHGNFGSVDDDPPAAMRYTEIRLALIASDGLLSEIGSSTVEFTPNFDNSQHEPIVLPAQLPFLLLNGCSGIAVGMATSVPPHNLGEIVNALIAIIQKPNLSDKTLLDLIPGPDFPTGGEVLINKGIQETYLEGRGSITMRGVAHIEEVRLSKGRHRRFAVVITELPYQLNKAGWIEKLAEKVNYGKIIGISDIRDESDRDGTRLVVELRKDTEPEKVLSILERRTSFKTNFSSIILALVDGQPVQLNLRQLLEHFLSYREITIIRRTQYTLKRKENRLEVVEGLLRALFSLTRIVEIIQALTESSNAKLNLRVHFDLSDIQSDAILNMPLRRLTSFEKENLHIEANSLRLDRKKLNNLLKKREALLSTIMNELKNLKKRFATPRRTRLREESFNLLNSSANVSQQEQILENLPKTNQLIISHDGQVQIIAPQLINHLHLEATLTSGHHPSPPQLLLPISQHPSILIFSSSGRVGLLRWEFAEQQPRNISEFLPNSLLGDQVIQILPLNLEANLIPSVSSIGLLSSDGHFKRLPIEEFHDLSGRAVTILRLKEGVSLLRVVECFENEELIIGSSLGRLLKIRIQTNILPMMKRTAQGTLLLKLLPGETVIGATCIKEEGSLMLATTKGQIKRLNSSSLRSFERCQLGQIGLRFRDSDDALVDLQSAKIEVMSGQLSSGRNFRLRVADWEAEDINGMGKKIELLKGEQLKRLIPLVRS
uniref:DNA topoisomerase (ATP-hydrolyzing) n=1 Tax=Paulinella chromatophora TaxID=39717 RepID=B1X4H7_PAUCH|nr:DNA gyrase/topoisomerase IV, subunit A [Paulinella chromatophora]ACB42846.1 DNA gyrase/topoisomerase IV, subunit A [Paulinella chromatophora]